MNESIGYFSGEPAYPIPNKHPLNEEIKCVDTCAIDAKIEQTTLKRAKFAANY